MKIFRYISAIFAFLILVSSCNSTERNRPTQINTSENRMKYASQIGIWDYDRYSIAEIRNPWDSTKLLARYILVPQNAGIPTDVDKNDIVIRTPLSSALVYTSVHAGAIKELGEVDIVTGVVDADFYKIPEIIEGLKQNKVVNAGSSSTPVAEKIIELSPDAILLSIYQGMDTKIIDKLGVPQIKFTDNMEQTPLGRAEWIKFIGALTATEAKADSIFSEVERNYLELCNLTRGIAKRPKVLVENMYQGVWYVSGGGSYQASMIKDAGGDYAWADDNSTGSLNLSFEQVFDKAYDADIWLLKVFGYDLTYDRLKETDVRNIQFKAANSGGVYYANTAEVNLFEEFPFHPDMMLKDYIKIFHPQTLPDYTPRYFKQMKN